MLHQASNAGDRFSVVRQLEERGFARLPIDAALAREMDRIYELGNQFFVLPEAEKMRYSLQSHVEGYRELGPEYSQVPERPDLTESFSAWNRNRGRPEVEAWSADSALHKALRDVADRMSVLMRAAFREMAEAWAPGAPELRFYNASYVQLNYYEPSRHAEELMQDPHEDAHLVTLARANAPGLEIEVDGKYVPAEAEGDSLLMMPGSLLSLMTGYKVKPMFHQVRNNRRRTPRCSLLMFVNPEIDQKLDPWIRNESNAGIDIIERANEGPKQFGMPTLTDGQQGEAFPELMQHKEEILAGETQPVRARG